MRPVVPVRFVKFLWQVQGLKSHYRAQVLPYLMYLLESKTRGSLSSTLRLAGVWKGLATVCQGGLTCPSIDSLGPSNTCANRPSAQPLGTPRTTALKASETKGASYWIAFRKLTGSPAANHNLCCTICTTSQMEDCTWASVHRPGP